jgi:aryl-alcohol dehydrogenase-like predicted oxidoreductase
MERRGNWNDLFLQKRRLGRIGWKASVLTLGGCGLGNLSQDKADAAVKLALRYGVNMIYVAPSYGRAELRLAPWVSKHRRGLFLAEKTMKRTRKEAWSELHRSLGRLEADAFDLYQLHAVGDLHELKMALGKNGAIQALREAKETGLVNYLGITGHKDMRVLRKAIERFDFDSVLLPVHMASMIRPSPQTDFRPVLQLAADRDMSVIAIKAIAKGRWKRGISKKYRTWYEPIDVDDGVLQAVSFTLSQKPVSTYSLPCDTRLWPMVLKAGLSYKKLNMNQQKRIIARSREADYRPLFPHQGEYSRE